MQKGMRFWINKGCRISEPKLDSLKLHTHHFVVTQLVPANFVAKYMDVCGTFMVSSGRAQSTKDRKTDGRRTTNTISRIAMLQKGCAFELP